MIFWYTDNEISRRFAEAFKDNGVDVFHISRFRDYKSIFIEDPKLKNTDIRHVFYGIHRGCGNAMRICQYNNSHYCYIDNGYFDARYVDSTMKKDLGGTYRIVKNDMIQEYEGKCSKREPLLPLTFCVLPPSPYSAYFYDTTPEDWIMEQHDILSRLGHKAFIRSKDSDKPLDDDLEKCDAVLAFNSMAVMRAVELKKAVYTTHGVFRNSLTSDLPYYDINDVRDFYADKQFTLDEIGRGEWMN